MKCLSCNSLDMLEIYNFNKIPLVNSFSLKKKISNEKFELNLIVCNKCKTCQLNESPKSNKLYNNYKHFSNASIDNIKHLKKLSIFLKKNFFKKKIVT